MAAADDAERATAYTRVEEPESDYTRIDAIERPRPRTIFGYALGSAALFVTLTLAVISLLARAPTALVATLKSSAATIPHTGEFCTGSGAATFSKVTLKTIVDRTVSGLLEPSEHQPKFEASDVIKVDDKVSILPCLSWPYPT